MSCTYVHGKVRDGVALTTDKYKYIIIPGN